MSKLGCECGSVIYDQTDFIPYKGSIIRDQDDERVYDGIAADVAAFIEAVAQGRRDEWIGGYFRRGYPPVDDESVVADIIARHVLKRRLTVYQCTGCGRIKIQEGSRSNMFSSFSPDEWQTGGRSILASEDESAEP